MTLLMQVDLDNAIPPEMYRAIAELLASLHHMENGAPAKVRANIGRLPFNPV